MSESLPATDAGASQAILEAERLWCLPFALTACWMETMAKMFWPAAPACLPCHFHEPHDQLVVPDEIEETGEHALFA